MRKIGPLASDHHLVFGSQRGSEWHYDRCPGCHERFKEGDYVTLVVIGPGGDAESRRRAREGNQAYNAIAIPAHWACVTGEE